MTMADADPDRARNGRGVHLYGLGHCPEGAGTVPV